MDVYGRVHVAKGPWVPKCEGLDKYYVTPLQPTNLMANCRACLTGSAEKSP